MARQQTSFQHLKSIVRAAFVGLVLVLLFERLDGPAAPATSLLCSAAGETLALLPALVPVAWQALQAFAFDHHWFSPCPLHMLISFWSLLRVMAGAV